MKILTLGLLSLASLAACQMRAAPVIRDFNPDRLANDKTWTNFKCKGEKLIAAMTASDQDAAKLMNLPAAQSEWHGDLKGEHLHPLLIICTT